MYLNLARKYRPQKFSEVVGQSVTKRILVNSIKMGRPIQGMLISGLRGTGKTTLARIYAKAINCESLSAEGDSCETCTSCLEANNGTHPDILEFDSASNNGKEFVQNLEDVVNRFKTFKRTVVILDETHMMTPQAQAAFLKLLEEPPEDVSFILVTTDPQKLGDTIRSRCLTMPLQPLKPAEVEGSIREVLKREGKEATEDFIRSLSLLGDGSLRDVQQYLEQTIVASGDDKLTVELLEYFTGAISITKYKKMAWMLCQFSLPVCLETVNDWHDSGVDLKEMYLTGFPLLMRDCMMYLNGFTDVPYETGIPVELFQGNLTLTLEHVKYFTKIWEDFERTMRETYHPKAIWEIFCVQICPLPSTESQYLQEELKEDY